MNLTLKRRLTRLYWFFADPVRRMYRFIVRYPIRAAKCLVECDGELLLVRIDYAHKRWGVAGGAVNRDETFEDAAKRELYEEVGIIADTVNELGEYFLIYENCPVTNYVFLHRAKNKNFAIDGLEIAEAGWFKPDQLPSPRQASVEKILAMYKNFASTPKQ